MLLASLAACTNQRARHDGYFLAPSRFVMELGSDWQYSTAENPVNWLKGAGSDPGWETGPAGFLGPETWRARGDKSGTFWAGSRLWLRKNFNLQTDLPLDELILWGRWDRSITVFINGVAAVRDQSPSFGYRYLGISDAARATLRTDAENHLAVVVEAELGAGFFDMGITTSKAMTDLPQSGFTKSPELEDIPALVKSYMELHGIPAGVLAVRRGSELVISQGFGYMDKEFTRPTPPDAIMRLASNDKTVTRDVIFHLLTQNPTNPGTGEAVTLSTPVFPLLKSMGVALAREPMDERIDEITIWHLLEHRSGLPALSPRHHASILAASAKDDMTELDLHDNVSWLYRQFLRFGPGGREEYSSTGYMVLRYLIHALTGDIEKYMQRVLGSADQPADVFIAHESLAGRVQRAGYPREPWYATLEEPYARWIQLENYTALAASAPAFVSYPRHASGDLLTFGNMAGSWSAALQVPSGDLSVAVFFNIAGYYDDIAGQLRDRLLNRPPSHWGPASIPFNYMPVLPAIQNPGLMR